MKHKEGFWHEFKTMRPALNKMNYVDAKFKNRLSDITYLIGFMIVFLPHSWLSFFYSERFNLASWCRFRADYNYLMEVNPEFVSVYFGGISLQFSIMTIAVCLRIYFSYKSNVILFVYDRYYIYIANLLSVSVFAGIGTWFFLNVSDFGLSGEHSWFQSDPGSSIRGLPQPMNSLVFISTGLLFTCIFFIILVFGLILIEFLKGKRVSYYSISCEK